MTQVQPVEKAAQLGRLAGARRSDLFLLPRPGHRPFWDHVLALHLRRLWRQGSGVGAGVSATLRPLPGNRGHQDLHLHRLSRHRFCA